MAAIDQSHAPAPGSMRRRRLRPPKINYELIGCGLHGHALVGTNARNLRPEDHDIARESDGLRWHRCLRCDAWVALSLPEKPKLDYPPDRSQVKVPLRGRPLRDRFVLRLIAVDKGLHMLALTALAVAIFLFAQHRENLHHIYISILNQLQGGLGGPVANSHSGIVGEANKLFAMSSTKLYLIGVVLALFAAVMAIECVGLWWARRWAEYLTLIETAALIPLEIYELTETVTTLKIITLVLNLLVVLYLAIAHRLFGLRGGAKAHHAQRARDSGWDAVDRATPQPRSLPTVETTLTSP